MYPGKVIDFIGFNGERSEYTVELYKEGLDTNPEIQKVVQLDVIHTDTIPKGTWVCVGITGNQYFMQVPVWL